MIIFDDSESTVLNKFMTTEFNQMRAVNNLKKADKVFLF